MHEGAEFFRGVAAVHGFEEAVGTGLQRQVNVLGELREAAEAVDEVLAEADRVGGGEAEALEPFDLMHGFEELHERAASVEFREFVASVEIDDLSEQGDFFAAAFDQFAHFADDAADAAAAFGAAGVGHDAEGAAHVAALHDGDKGAGRDGGVVADGFLRTGFLRGVDHGKTEVVHRGVMGHFAAQDGVHMVGDLVEFLRADDQVEVGNVGKEGGAAALGHAAEQSVDRVRALFPEASEQAHFAEGLLFRHIAHAAGIEQDNVGFVGLCGHFIAPGDQHLRDLLRVALVHLASVGLEKHLGHSGRDYCLPRPRARAANDWS